MSPITMDNKKLLWDWLGLGSGLVGPIGIVPLKYLLRANFNAADQGYADAQVLDTVAEGVQDGQLTVVEVDGTLAISGNECAFTAQSTPTWGDQGFYSQAITRALGRGLLGTVNKDGTSKIAVAFVDSADVDITAAGGNRWMILFEANDEIQIGVINTSSFSIGQDHSASTDYQLAIILGGYDVNGAPWVGSGSKADYTYGTWFLAKGSGIGDGASWTLLWTTSSGNTSPLYAALSNYSASGTIDDFKVPDEDLSAIQVPVAYSSFTAANGTSLDAITSEVGVWVEEHGQFDIQGNKGHTIVRGSSPAECHATTDVSESDGIVDCIVTTGGVNEWAGLVLRYQDNANFWWAAVRPSVNGIGLFEVVSGTTTQRASASVTINTSTAYNIRAILDGQQIDCFVDAGNKCSYASATFNQTKTKHGLFSTSVDIYYDNFTIFPRTSTTYDSSLNGV